MEVTGAGIEPSPQQSPEPQQWQYWILNLLSHKGTLESPFFFSPQGRTLWYIEIPRLGVKLELQLPAYTTVTATEDPSSSVTYTTGPDDARFSIP